MEFIENFYRQSILRGFKPLEQESAVNMTVFTLVKVENTTLCLLQVSDINQLDASQCISLRDQELEQAIALNAMYSSIWVVFLRVGNGFPVDTVGDNPEEYYGQSPYPIYWHIDPATQEITVPKGQPDDIMGLKAIISRSVIGDIKQESWASSTAYEQSADVEAPSSQDSISETGSETFIKEAESLASESNPAVPSVSGHGRASFPICTCILAAINILIMLLMYLQGYAHAPISVAARFGAIIPHLIWDAGQYYRLLTAMFIHFGLAHLFFNITGMLIFGTRIERYYGKGPFLIIYFVSGLTASVASLLFTQGFSAGASGAVYGLLGAAFVYTRYTRKSMDIINNHIIAVYLIMGLGMGFVIPNIDHFGHIGGLIAGLLTGLVILSLNKKRNEKRI